MKIKDENIISNYATNELINEVINAIKNSGVQVNSIKTSDSFLESAADISFKIPSLDRSTASDITFKLKKAFERKGFRTPKFMNSDLPTGYNFIFRGKDILRGVVFVNIGRKDCTVYVTSKSKLSKDSKLYKVGDKIVKASSVNDAINKVKDPRKDKNTHDASKKAKWVSIPFILNIAKDYARVIGNGLNNKTIEGFKLTLASKKIDTEEGKEDIDVNKGYITLIFRYQFTGSGRYDPSDLPDDVMKYMNTNRSLFSTYMGSLHTRYTLRYNASAKTLTIIVLLY